MGLPGKKKLCWHFDFISPFAYLQFQYLKQVLSKRQDIEIELRPLLFAGLLQHHEHKGPAEIPAKRQMTYRYCHWYAEQHGIAFHMPAAHPFNPLPLLRLAIALDCQQTIVDKLFQHVWVNSEFNPSFFSIDALTAIAGFENAADLIADPKVKSRLKSNTDLAIARGIFGVPTIEIDNQLFWGMDMTRMAFEYLDHPHRLLTEEYNRLGQLPVAKAR